MALEKAIGELQSVPCLQKVNTGGSGGRNRVLFFSSTSFACRPEISVVSCSIGSSFRSISADDLRSRFTSEALLALLSSIYFLVACHRTLNLRCLAARLVFCRHQVSLVTIVSTHTNSDMKVAHSASTTLQISSNRLCSFSICAIGTSTTLCAVLIALSIDRSAEQISACSTPMDLTHVWFSSCRTIWQEANIGEWRGTDL